MFRLPVCPHCRTVYHYKDVKSVSKRKKAVCYHCKNEFRISKAGYAVIFAIAALLAVIINLIILSLTANFISSVIPLTIVSIIAVLIAFLLAPYFINFKSDKKPKK